VKAGLATHLEAVKRQHERDSSSSEPAGSSCPGRCHTFRHSFASTCWRPRHPDGAGVARPPRRQHDYDLHPRPQPRPRRRSEPGRPPRRLVSEESQRRDTQPRGPDIPGLRNACARRGSCPPKARDARRSCSLAAPRISRPPHGYRATRCCYVVPTTKRSAARGSAARRIRHGADELRNVRR
jgi:hypothetical protein